MEQCTFFYRFWQLLLLKLYPDIYVQMFLISVSELSISLCPSCLDLCLIDICISVYELSVSLFPSIPLFLFVLYIRISVSYIFGSLCLSCLDLCVLVAWISVSKLSKSLFPRGLYLCVPVFCITVT